VGHRHWRGKRDPAKGGDNKFVIRNRLELAGQIIHR